MERHVYDENQPNGMMSLLNLRNALRGLFQGDLMSLRPRATMVLDAMEYGTDAAAQAAWAGTGLTVTKSTTKQEGSYSVQAVVDATANRDLQQSKALNLSGFKQVTLWHRVNATTQSLRFYVEDGSGNRSYWNLTTHASADTWKQDTITLATPDGNNGTAATLTSITKFGYYQLPASKTFLFDTIKAICGLNIAVEGAQIASFYRNAYLGQNNMTFAGGPSPNITPPASNPRIDLLALNSSNALVWVTGTEASSPAEPTFPMDKIPVCLIYCKSTMAKVVDYEDKDANPNEAYIYRDIRPFLVKLLSTFTVLTDVPSSYAGAGNYRVHVNSGATALEFIIDKFITLVDCPNSYSGQALKLARVNADATALEFWTLAVNLATQISGVLASVNGGTGSSAAANAANGVVVLNASSQLPAVSGALLTNLPAPASGSITQAKLATDTGSVSVTGSSLNLTLPGGGYGFYPQTKVTGGIASFEVSIRINTSDTGSTYTANIFLSVGVTRTGYAQQRYITASSPDHWIFLKIDKVTKEIVGGYQAPDHPCYGTGETEEELTHPFGEYDASKYEVVVIDNQILSELKSKITRKRDLLTIINEDYEVDYNSNPIYAPREIIEIDEFGDKPGKVLGEFVTPDWAKIKIKSDKFHLKKRTVSSLPAEIKYKKLKLK